ncbi:hypothetical protein NKR23_g12338 [Pleurostoma richardsiae]|uniref:Uncharacterized protein n=1 Tax=Pleurostoma richardsiae TaxID=41990 RepID=A0AA38R0C6_9PEZI|nr:hypothetical protein NKR23_g12338 [Pleurostoma richardsiae]
MASIESDDSDLKDLFWPNDDNEDDGAEVVTPGDTEDHDIVSPQNPGRTMAPASETRAVEAQRPEPSSGRSQLHYPRSRRASPPVVPLKRTFADLQHGSSSGDTDKRPFRKILKNSTQSDERSRRPLRLRLKYSA